MEFSSRFVSFASQVFWYKEHYGTPYSLSDSLTLDSNNVFSRSIIVDLNKDEIELPVIAIRHFEEAAGSSIIPSFSVEKVILPLYNNTYDQSRRTFDTIMAQFFANTSYESRLLKIITNKGEVYYGGKGIILDGNFNPLLLCTLLARIVKEEERDVLTYYRPVCHINPKVFIESDKLVNKGIIKKLIPYYSNYDTCFPRVVRRTVNNDPESEKVKVIIDDFSHLFVEPVKPTPSSCSNESLNQCLVDNVEDILALI